MLSSSHIYFSLTMNKKFVYAGVGLIVVIGAAAVAWNQPRNSYVSPRPSIETPAQTTSTPSRTTVDSNVYTRDQIAQHADASNCWTFVNGGVYDLTPWVSRHPGGEEAILSLCGKDGSSAFNDQHGGDRRPESVLASYKIGTLAQ